LYIPLKAFAGLRFRKKHLKLFAVKGFSGIATIRLEVQFLVGFVEMQAASGFEKGE